MFGICAICGKRRDTMALVKVKRLAVKPDSDVDQVIEQTECVWCIKAEASTKELYPDSDNLVGCPRCGNDILRNQGMCSHCMAEVRAYYS